MTADTDDDNDGVLDTADAFSLISLGSLTDTDGDGRPNDCDSDCQTLGMTADTMMITTVCSIQPMPSL